MQIQHGITKKTYRELRTQSIYSEGSEESYIVRITIMGHMTQHTEHTGNGRINIFGYKHLKRKKAIEPDYIQDPPKGTRS